MKVLVIIPAYNEEKNIKTVVRNLEKSCPQYDYLIINDCSNDGTELVCKELGYNYMTLPYNLGIGGAVQAGYKYAQHYGYDIAVQHDGDGQHNPDYIVKAIELIEKNECDIVIGSRYISKVGFVSTTSRRMGIKILSGLIEVVTKTKVKDVTSGFRAVGKDYIALYAKDYPQDYPEPEAIVLAQRHGAKIREISVVMNERLSGKSSINFRRSIYYMIKVSIAIVIQALNGRRERL